MNFVFALMLILFPLLGFTQEGAEMQPAEIGQDDEKMLDDLQSQRDERQKALEALQKVGDAPKNGPTLTPEEQLKKLGYSGPLDPSALFSPEALDAMEKLLKEAKMWEVPEEDLRQQVIQSFSWMKSYPRLQGFVVDLMKDKKAMFNAIAIVRDRERLKTYLYFWIGIMFASYYLKRLFVSKYWKKPVKVFASLSFSIVVTIITMSTFCIIFSEEMKPIIAIVKKHL